MLDNRGETPVLSSQKRPTIIFLALALSDDVNGPRWRGMVDEARYQQVNFISLYIGLISSETAPTRNLENLLCDVLQPDLWDGMILASIVRDDQLTADEIHGFYQKLPLNVVSVRPTLPHIPFIPIDNYHGMRAVIAHLIDVHHRRHIAFLRGPEGHPYAEERYRAYVDVLRDYGLPFDPRLVTPPADWATPSLPILLDDRRLQPGKDFDAVAAVSDVTQGSSTLQILAQRGLRVPQDVAVVAFDNVRSSRVQIPPLTSVQAPFYEQGRQAVKLLMAKIEQTELPQITAIPARIVTRQSCGCPSAGTARVIDDVVAFPPKLSVPVIELHRDTVVAAMLAAFEPSPEPAHAWMEQILESFLADIAAGTFDASLVTWQNVLIQAMHTSHEATNWHAVLSTLRHYVLPTLTSDAQVAHEESLCGQIRVSLGEHLKWIEQIRQYAEQEYTQKLRNLEQQLMTTFHLEKLMDILAENLPGLGIDTCYLALYDPLPEPAAHPRASEWACLMMAYTPQGRIALEPGGRRFPTYQLVPPDLLPSWHQLHVEGLYFQEQALGFIGLAIGPGDGQTYEILRSQISSALQGALLVRRVQSDARELGAAYEEITILNRQLQKENLRMSAELNVARQIQQMVLPTTSELDKIEGLDIVGYMCPADEVGGDYYDVLACDDAIHVGIGDVTGHGLESGVLMLMTQTAIRTLVERGESDPQTFLETLNKVILKNMHRMQVDRPITFALVKYQGGNLHIVGQHEEVLIVRRGGKVERLDTVPLGFPLGLEREISSFIAGVTILLQPGDGVVLYTDGITEAENVAREWYGLERLCTVLSRYWDHSAETIKQAVIDDVMSHIGKNVVYDDVTLVVLKQK